MQSFLSDQSYKQEGESLHLCALWYFRFFFYRSGFFGIWNSQRVLLLLMFFVLKFVVLTISWFCQKYVAFVPLYDRTWALKYLKCLLLSYLI